MRIVIIPNPTFRDLEGESEFLMVRQMARDILASRSDVFVYIVVPSWCSEATPEDRIEYLVDDSDSKMAFHDRVGAVPMKFGDWFNVRRGEFPVDAVFTTRTVAVPQMVRYLRDFREKTRVPVFVDENIAMDKTVSHWFIGDDDLMARTLGYAFAEHSFFDTDFEKERAVKAARYYLNAQYVRKVKAKITTVPCGVDVGRVDRLIAGVKRSARFQILCGNRLNASKRPEKVAELYSQFYAYGRKVNIVFSTPESGAFFDKLKDKGHMQMHKGLTSDKFVKLAAKSHVVVETTVFGGFSLGLAEMILAGPVVILPKLKWIKTMVSEKIWETYPYFFKNFQEAGAMLRHVYDNYDKATKSMEPLRKHWRKNYDSRFTSLGMFKHIVQSFDEFERSGLWSKSNVDLIKSGLADMKKKGMKKIDLELLYLFMVENSRAMDAKDIFHPLRGRLSRWAIYKWMLKDGWADMCTGKYPIFVKEKK